MENLFDILIGIIFLLVVSYMGYNISLYIKNQIGGNMEILPEMAIATTYIMSLPGDFKYKISTNNFDPNQEIRFFFTESRINSKIEIGVCASFDFWGNLLSDIIKGIIDYIAFGTAGLIDVAILSVEYYVLSDQVDILNEKATFAGLIVQGMKKAAAQAAIKSALEKKAAKILEKAIIRFALSALTFAGPIGIAIGAGISAFISSFNTIKKKFELSTVPLANCGEDNDLMYQQSISIPLSTIGSGYYNGKTTEYNLGEFAYTLNYNVVCLSRDNNLYNCENFVTVRNLEVDPKLEGLSMYNLLEEIYDKDNIAAVYFSYNDKYYLDKMDITIKKREIETELEEEMPYNSISYEFYIILKEK